jgi:hypothetical protein
MEASMNQRRIVSEDQWVAGRYGNFRMLTPKDPEGDLIEVRSFRERSPEDLG